MTRMDWAAQPRIFEDGVDRGVLYAGGVGVPWNGLVAVNEKAPEMTAGEPVYFDGIPRFIPQGRSDFEASLEALTYPKEFEQFSGLKNNMIHGQPRATFGLSYRTQIVGGYKIHLVYGATAIPNQKTRTTTGAVNAPSLFKWDISTRPIALPNAAPAAHLVVDSTLTNPGLISALENVLYGSASLSPSLPGISELMDIFSPFATMIVTDNGDGTVTVTAPNGVLDQLSSTEWQINSPGLTVMGPDTVQVQSW